MHRVNNYRGFFNYWLSTVNCICFGFALFYSVIDSKICATFAPNEMQNQNKLQLTHAYFCALYHAVTCIVALNSDWLNWHCFSLLWLVGRSNCFWFHDTPLKLALITQLNKCNFLTAIQREEDKVKISLKDAAKRGDKDVCNILAKEVIRSRKAVNKIYASKAQLNSVEMSMKNQLGMFQLLVVNNFTDQYSTYRI